MPFCVIGYVLIFFFSSLLPHFKLQHELLLLDVQKKKLIRFDHKEIETATDQQKTVRLEIV